MSNVHTVLTEVWQVYVMRCGAFAKIGYSADPQKRLATVQVYNPQPVELVAVIPCPYKDAARDLEWRLHQRFVKHRVHGEWFRWSRPIRRFVRSQHGGS